MGSYWMSVEFSIWKDGKVPEMDGDDGCTTTWTYFMSLNHTLKMVRMVNFTFRVFHNFRKQKEETCYVLYNIERRWGNGCEDRQEIRAQRPVLRQWWPRAIEMQRICGSETHIQGQKLQDLLQMDDITVLHSLYITLEAFRPHLWREW